MRSTFAKQSQFEPRIEPVAKRTRSNTSKHNPIHAKSKKNRKKQQPIINRNIEKKKAGDESGKKASRKVRECAKALLLMLINGLKTHQKQKGSPSSSQIKHCFQDFVRAEVKKQYRNHANFVDANQSSDIRNKAKATDADSEQEEKSQCKHNDETFGDLVFEVIQGKERQFNNNILETVSAPASPVHQRETHINSQTMPQEDSQLLLLQEKKIAEPYDHASLSMENQHKGKKSAVSLKLARVADDKDECHGMVISDSSCEEPSSTSYKYKNALYGNDEYGQFHFQLPEASG